MKNQNKMSKLSKKQEKETEVLAKRIMPKTDFLKVIEHDKLYYNTMNQALEFNLVKQDVLGNKCKPILARQTREDIIKHINTLTEWAETQVKVLDIQGKLRIQQKLIEDKEMHFENVFLPQFNKELEEAKANFDNTLKQARKFMNNDREGVESIKEKINYELTWWDKCSKEQQSNEEYIVQIYKPLKRLLNAYDNKNNK
jgi:hypothetical protein